MTLKELCAEIKKLRIKSKKSKKDISDYLHISQSMIDAIEQCRIEAFPHPVYAKGNIKVYAQMMKIPPEDVAVALKELDSKSVAYTLPLPPIPARSQSGKIKWDSPTNTGFAILLLAFFILACIFVYRSDFYDDIASMFTTEKPTITVTEINDDDPHKSSTTTSSNQSSGKVLSKSISKYPEGIISDESSTDGAKLAKDDVADPEKTVEDNVEMNSDPYQTKSFVKKDDSSKAVNGVSESEHVINITCIETTWLAFRPKNGKKETLELQPGDKYTYKFNDSVLIRIGNAGGIFATLDGVPLKSFGRSGVPLNVRLPRLE